MYNIKYVRSDGKELEMNIDTGYIITTMDGVTGHSTTVSTAQGYEQLGETVLGMATSGKQIAIYGYILDQQTEKKKSLCGCSYRTLTGGWCGKTSISSTFMS